MKRNNSTVTAEPKRKRARQRESIIPIDTPPVPEGEFKIVPISEIDPSPFNHRKIFPVRKMEELAASIALHGIIENLVLRPLPSGRYELVAGERRNRAAKMAGLTEVPAIIKDLTDEQVKEIQLAENIQREDPHPLEAAEAIGELQTRYKTLDEVALRLGKSKTFVYTHLKLLSLIPDIREMFIAEKLTLQQAVEIASLSADSQQEFYNEDCANWREEDFELYELSDMLGRFRYDLSDAPFNTKDKNLLPDMGACTKCPHNTATVRSLFAEMEKSAVCTNTACYHRKHHVQFTNELRTALQEHQPAALLFYGSPSPFLKRIIAELAEAASLGQFNYHGVSVIRAPELPLQDDYTLEKDTDDEEDEDSRVSDPDGFAVAMDEYNTELEEYRTLIENGTAFRGLLVTERKFEAFLFSPDSPQKPSPAAPLVTAAQVQTAIRAGEATPELLRAEIARIQTKEIRSKELDREKIQLQLHEVFLTRTGDGSLDPTLTAADSAAAWLLIFQTLDYSSRHKVESTIFPQKDKLDSKSRESIYERFAALTPQQVSYLIRMAIAAKSESKFPTSATAHFLNKMADAAGVDIPSMEKDQQEKAATRQNNQIERIKALEKKIGEMQSAA